MFQRVNEFHRIFGQHIADAPALPDMRERALRMSLLLEEVDEFCVAYFDDDLVEMADGLADMCYIIAGTCVSYGICPEGSFESPYEDVLGQMTMFYNLKLDEIVREDFAKYVWAETDNDLPRIKDTLMQLMTSIFGISLHLGIPLNQVFAEVHRSNLAKAPDGVVQYREDGKVQKPSGWTPPDIKSILGVE
jgi:predicted HAD superfamily Cof-like phosphohydrolase